MSKRKRKIIEESKDELDTLKSSLLKPHEKRRRRPSDVIDSIGDREISLSRGLCTPQRSKAKKDNLTSPDQGYYTTPESESIFVPEWLREKSDLDTTVDTEINCYSLDSSLGEPSAVMVVQHDSEDYKMNHKNRGKCVIFNQEIFESCTNRTGSTNDAFKILHTFQNIGFDVEILNNLKHGDVIDKISELSKDDYTDCDCICIFMLTHGAENDLIWAKDAAYKSDDIWKPFTADRCKTLAGKPKFFFFQTCRGSQLDGGVVLRRGITTETDSGVISYKIPTHADFLIAHSTVQGFYSWRNPEKGTWYVQTLCNVIDKYHKTKDLIEMLTITARKIATEFSSYNDLDPYRHNKKQVPSISSMLTRNVYFT